MAQTDTQTHRQMDMASLRPTLPRGAELVKAAPNGADGHTFGHGDSMTESAQWGQFSETQQNSPKL